MLKVIFGLYNPLEMKNDLVFLVAIVLIEFCYDHVKVILIHL
jgi:hypothetical protein